MGRNYSRKDSPASSDLSLIWDSTNSDWRLTPFSGIATLVQSLLTTLATAIQQPVTQYQSPLTGFQITLEGTSDIHLILLPAAILATGEIVLPISPGAVDKQKVLVTTSQEITALTINGNGAILLGEPTTIVAGGYFTMKYDLLTDTWARVA